MGEIKPAELRRQLMEAFELGEARVRELIEIGSEGLRDRGGRWRGPVWRNTCVYRCSAARRVPYSPPSLETLTLLGSPTAPTSRLGQVIST